MATNIAIGRLCLVTSACMLAAAGGLATQIRPVGPADVLREYQARSRERSGESTPAQASDDADALLAALSQADPADPVAPMLVKAAFEVLPTAGRHQEAAALARQHMNLKQDSAWRADMANESIGMMMRQVRLSGTAMTEEARQVCREDALQGLRDQPGAEALIESGKLHDLASIAPLLHVCASTMPTREERMTELRSLQRTLRAAQDAATASGQRNPVAMDLWGVTKELVTEYLASTSNPSVAAFREIVLQIPLQSNSGYDAGSFLVNAAHAPELSREFRLTLVRSAGPSEFPMASILQARYHLLSEDRAASARHEGNDTAVITDAAVLLHDLHAFEATVDPAGPLPQGLRSPRTLPLMIEQTLATQWEIEWRRNRNCGAVAGVAQEYLRRFPDARLAAEMTRVMSECR